jgi:hypothetical protein
MFAAANSGWFDQTQAIQEEDPECTILEDIHSSLKRGVQQLAPQPQVTTQRQVFFSTTPPPADGANGETLLPRPGICPETRTTAQLSQSEKGGATCN